MKSLLFSFQGRVNRAPYWYVHLIIVAVEVAFLTAIMVPVILANDPELLADSAVAINLVGALIFIPMFWISLAVTVKRCHDRDKSGWWMLIMLVPLIGGIWFIIDVGFLPGTPGPNRFGPDPLGY
ncbi:MAG: yhaH [Reyranella sp.]|nr:yhaH [Reyranella sp.]